MGTHGASAPNEELEREIATHVREARWNEAATCGLQGYGGEVLGFLHTVVADASEADEAFSALCERVWDRLPTFRGDSTFRTWLYGVARNLAREHRRANQRRLRRFAPGAGTSAASRVAERVRSTTPIHLRSETKTQLQRIRDALPQDERALLVLRLDRDMQWTEIARILADEPLDEAGVKREAARLRKRFERVKARVAELIRAQVEEG